MRCLWPSESQRNWTFDFIYWTLRHNQNHPNWNLGNIFAWKTTFFYGLSYFIHLWKSFCLKLALNLSDPQTPHITTIFENFLQTILFYVNKSACYILVTICEPCRIPTHRQKNIRALCRFPLSGGYSRPLKWDTLCPCTPTGSSLNFNCSIHRVGNIPVSQIVPNMW